MWCEEVNVKMYLCVWCVWWVRCWLLLVCCMVLMVWDIGWIMCWLIGMCLGWWRWEMCMICWDIWWWESLWLCGFFWCFLRTRCILRCVCCCIGGILSGRMWRGRIRWNGLVVRGRIRWKMRLCFWCGLLWWWCLWLRRSSWWSRRDGRSCIGMLISMVWCIFVLCCCCFWCLVICVFIGFIVGCIIVWCMCRFISCIISIRIRRRLARTRFIRSMVGYKGVCIICLFFCFLCIIWFILFFLLLLVCGWLIFMIVFRCGFFTLIARRIIRFIIRGLIIIMGSILCFGIKLEGCIGICIYICFMWIRIWIWWLVKKLIDWLIIVCNVYEEFSERGARRVDEKFFGFIVIVKGFFVFFNFWKYVLLRWCDYFCILKN